MASSNRSSRSSSLSEATHIDVFIFGDQSTRFAPALQDLLLNRKGSAYLHQFLEQASFLLRRETSSLSALERQLFPKFTTLAELVSEYQARGGSAALGSALACVYHLASFIAYYDSPGRKFPEPANTYIAGLCVGSLAAAAVSCSQTLNDLILAGLDAVKVAFRLGLRVQKVSTLLLGFPAEAPTTGNSESWSIVVTEASLSRASAPDVLQRFKQESNLPPTQVPYISSIGHTSITISGPPHILRQFIEKCLQSPRDGIAIPIHAPYHADHLYTEEDVTDIITAASPLRPFSTQMGVIPPSDVHDCLAEPLNLPRLLRACIRDILMVPLQISDVTAELSRIVETVSASSAIDCTLIPIGSAGIGSSIESALRPSLAGLCKVDNSFNERESGPGTSEGSVPEDLARSLNDSKIAIVSMSGRFPDAADLDTFWQLLSEGRDVHKKVPADRFSAENHYDATGQRKNTSKVMNGCWIENPGLFDPRFFNISPKEAEQSDPGQRMALQTAYEALEMAGIVPDRTPSTRRDRVGVFYGMTSDDWREVNSGQDVDTYFIPGGNRAFTPGRLNYFFKFSGPSASIDTACSSSLTAIHMACNSLWRHDCDTAIAGGTNVMTNPDNFAGLDRGHFLSRTGNCNTFDDGADGYCRADGVGTIILKRLEDAEADKDPIIGIIRGAYTNHSAEAVSITRPHAGAQEYIFSKLLRESGVKPYDVSYVEMHGTGTQAGDATEMSSVLNTFAPTSGTGGRSPSQSLHLGSVKSNVGHGESASGVVALIKTLLMMQYSTIPPHCGIKTKINHHFPTDMKQRNVHIAFEPTAWPRPSVGSRSRYAFVNNFSAAGGNSALLLEDAPRQLSIETGQTLSQDDADPRKNHIVTVSAKCTESLTKNLERLRDYVSQQQDQGLESGFLAKLAYTTTARRMHHNFRVALTADSPASLLKSLESAAQKQETKRIPNAAPSVGFVFSGQGAQYSGMGKDYLKHSPLFRSEIMAYDAIARLQGFPSFLPLLRGEVETETLGPVEIQLGLACLQMALAKLWKSLGIEPSFVLGHSLGHYASLNIAGVLSTSDTIYLTGTRAQLLVRHCQSGSHSMLAIRAPLEQVREHLNSDLHQVACINGPRETVISGAVSEMNKLAEQLAAEDIKATRLNVPFAFHSAQVDPILGDLEDAASRVTFHPSKIPVLCALEGSVISPGQTDMFSPTHLSRHCREAVNFRDALRAGEKEGLIKSTPGPGATVWVEIGPHTVCSNLVKVNLGPNIVTANSLRRDENCWKTMTQSLSAMYSAGFSIDWNEYHRGFDACHEVLRLPSYSWDNKNYWIQYQYDWTLTKGDPPSSLIGASEDSHSPASTFSTPSVQRILKESITGQNVQIVAETDFASPLLTKIAQGHRVNGANLCTSSLYADIGLTLGKYLLDKHHPDLKDHGIDVRTMNVHKPLILKEDAQGAAVPTLIRIEINHNLESSVATMELFSIDSKDDTKRTQHADCQLHLSETSQWEADWNRQVYLIRRSIEYLETRAAQGLDSTLSTGMIYKMFSSLVDYQDDFKGLSEVLLHSDEREATAKVRFRTERGDFHCNPMWIDSCGQTTGFMMNCHQTTPSDIVYVNHGWGSIKLAKEFKEGETYRTYIRMHPIEDGAKYAGDLYIFDENWTVVGVFGDMTFQLLQRRILNMAFPPTKGSTTVAPPAQRPGLSQSSMAQAQASKLRSPDSSGASTPPSEVFSPPALLKPPPLAVDTNAVVDSQLRPVLGILAEEIGIAPEALADDGLEFADYGVDSLLSLTITGRFREEVGIDVESTVFLLCPTLGHLKTLLGLGEAASSGSSTPPSASESDLSRVSTNPTEIADEDVPDTKAISKESAVDTDERSLRLSKFRATSTLLQGNASKARHCLFLLPDGSGSATSYASLTPVSEDVVVYGLNCPWLKDADHLVEFGLTGLVELYVKEILRRRPQGPYALGGWSAGGICAYDAAILLTRAGHEVSHLFLLDTPNPIGLEKLPPRLYDFLDKRNVFGQDNPHAGEDAHSSKAPEWLIKHFLAFVEALDHYIAIPWSTAMLEGRGSGDAATDVPLPPKTHMLWADDGVCKNADDPRPEYRPDDPREMRWLLENRTDFGSNGWDALIEGGSADDKGGRLSIERIAEANHFTMLKRGRNAGLVSQFLATAFAS